MAAWVKAEGDEINAGDVVLELETDKATLDFEAQDDSFLARILVDVSVFDVSAYQSSKREHMIMNLHNYRGVIDEQRHDAQVVWSTVYPRVASAVYGDNVVVYAPSTRGFEQVLAY